ncbi:hypothetical protein AKO1_004338 [Acrasis kona]|uniref:RKD4 n=1 Tax=Acrasis kona TaxID=1008807 RepID=A0AAW2YLT8_9EUKA
MKAQETKRELVFIDFESNLHSIQKKKARKIDITPEQIVECTHLSQNEACKVLNVSLSTLKRRYYELGIGKWEQKHAKQVGKVEENKLDISYILNKKDGRSATHVNCDIDWLNKSLGE